MNYADLIVIVCVAAILCGALKMALHRKKCDGSCCGGSCTHCGKCGKHRDSLRSEERGR